MPAHASEQVEQCSYKGCCIEAEPGSKLCIFHQPCPKDLRRFKEALSDQIDGAGARRSRNARLSFRGYVFPAEVVARSCSGESSSGITVPRLLSHADFGDVRFAMGADFTRARFSGMTRFDGASFDGRAFFADARFDSASSFLNATFKNTAIFSHALFVNPCRFAGVWFEDGALFQGSHFFGQADFDRASFARLAHFGMTRFHRVARFQETRFKGVADFSGAEFKDFVDFSESILGACVVFLDARFLGLADFGGARARRLDLGADRPRVRGWSQQRCGVYHRLPFEAKRFWQFAAKTFATSGEGAKADTAFYFERINQWKHLRAVEQREAASERRGIPVRFFRASPLALRKGGFSLLWVLDVFFLRWTTAYGMSIARLFAAWLVVLAGFGITYALAPWMAGRPTAAT